MPSRVFTPLKNEADIHEERGQAINENDVLQAMFMDSVSRHGMTNEKIRNVEIVKMTGNAEEWLKCRLIR